jgi:phosphoribosylformylglycinamidine cyclo-ligase
MRVRPTYEQAGVSLGKAERLVERLRTAVESTRTPGVAGAFGTFAGLYALDGERLLAASTDGLGTKLVLARRAGRLRDAGACLAAHCINDVLTTGAEPLFFLDYVAAASLDLGQVAELVEGMAATCRAAGCAIVGGETAEMPGVYRDGELDVAGTCVGAVSRGQLVDGSRVEDGDAILGLPSSGLHCNGYTLVRRLLGDAPFDADLLLAPTRLYLEDVRRLRERCDVRALANVTGGGIPGNLARVLPAGLGAVVDPARWQRPPVFGWLDAQGVPEDEQRRVFNLGVGYCAVVPAAEAPRAGVPVIGRVEAGVEGVAFAT